MGTYKPTTISHTEVTLTGSLGGVPSLLGTPFPVRMAVKDAVLTMDDVELPEGRLCDRLRAEQHDVFFRAQKSASVGGA